MQQITKRALELVEAFENQISTLSAEERILVLKRLTSHILALNEHVEEALKTVPRSGNITNGGRISDADHIHDFM